MTNTCTLDIYYKGDGNMDYPYLLYGDQIIPILEIERMLKTDNFIFIGTKDETYKLEFDNEEHRDVAYEELLYELQEYFGLRD